MRPFFGLSNRIASIITSFAIFGYSVYIIISESVISLEQIKIFRKQSKILASKPEGGVDNAQVEYDFESTTTSLFGLYEMEISIVKICVSFLLFIVLLVGAAQRSKILLKIWMMIHAIVIILGLLATLVILTDSHINNTGEPSNTIQKFLITLAFSLWFFAIVLSLHEDLELADQINGLSDGGQERGKFNCIFVAKKGTTEEKSPPYYDC